MNIKAPVDITGDEAARLATLHRAFVAKLNATPEKHRDAVIRTTAANITGQVDPFTQGIAGQMLRVVEIRDRITAAAAEIEAIDRSNPTGARLGDPGYGAAALARKAELEEQIKTDQARALGIRDESLNGAREEAVLHFRGEDAEAAKSRAILEMRDNIRAEAAQREIATRARALVNGERMRAGLPPLPDGDE